VTEEELSCRIIEAEATYLSAILCFFEESMAAFFRAALLIRKAIRGYKYCNGILQRQVQSLYSNHSQNQGFLMPTLVFVTYYC
jgi:hypothetical protein